MGEDYVDRLGCGERFKRIDQLGKEWVLDIRNNQPEEPGTSESETTRIRVRNVVEFSDNLAYPSRSLFGYVARTVEDAGHGRCGDLCALCNLDDVHRHALGEFAADSIGGSITRYNRNAEPQPLSY